MPPQYNETAFNGLRCGYRLGTDATSPLVLSLHGKAGTLFITQPFFSAYPSESTVLCFEAPLADALGGYSWWEYDPTTERTETQWDKALVAADQLAGALNAFENAVELAPNVRLGAGFSQGGALLSVLLQQAKVNLNAIALLASFVIPSPAPADLRRKKVFCAHGTNDDRIALEVAERGRILLETSGAEVTFVVDETGHKVGTNGMRELRRWMMQWTAR